MTTVAPPSQTVGGSIDTRHAIANTVREWREMFERRSLPGNLAAGLTVTLVALPLNLALAIAAGLPPSAGLISGAVAGVIGALLGGSRYQITGPEIALAPITLEIVARHGLSGLIVATFLAGLMQVGFGLCRVGRLIHAIPVPVVAGFLSAVGLLVLDAQLPRLLGLPETVSSLARTSPTELLAQVEPAALWVGGAILALLVAAPRIDRRVPAPLLALCTAVGLGALLGLRLPTVEPFAATFPGPSLPPFGQIQLLAIMPEALALALLASMDSLLCAVSLDAMVGRERTRMDQELVAQGLANVASACFGGMPVAAAVVRSAAAYEAGASTRLASLSQAAWLLVVLFALAPWISLVPLVALAAILLVVGFRLIQWRLLVAMWRVARFEGLVFVATALGILLTDFVFGVAIGVGAALVHFAHQQRASLTARPIGSIPAPEAEPSAPPASPEPKLLRLSGPLFFASQSSVDASIAKLGPVSQLVVDVSALSTVDVSGATALTQALRRLAASGTTVRVRALGRGLDPLLRWSIEHHALGLIEIESGGGAALAEPPFGAHVAAGLGVPSGARTAAIPGLRTSEEGVR